MPQYLHDPHSDLDYTWDWSDWLVDGDSGSSYEIIDASVDLTLGAQAITATAYTRWIEGGTVGELYPVTCRITTAEGRVDDRTIQLLCRER